MLPSKGSFPEAEILWHQFLRKENVREVDWQRDRKQNSGLSPHLGLVIIQSLSGGTEISCKELRGTGQCGSIGGGRF